MKIFVGFIVGLCLASCAGPAHQTSPYERSDAHKDEIRDLWIQIRGWRVEAGMTPDPSTAVIRATAPMSIGRLQICPANPRTETCQDVCNLKDAICANAARICDIAAKLGGDPWADGKCASSKASCKESRARCCECAEDEPPPPDAGAPDAPAAGEQ
ncbi:MAG TPA: hypothetical protein VFG83_03055 [Kofleriaceae bacterium]|nr:hypothetical protein [Kofleriaceae bacterium]